MISRHILKLPARCNKFNRLLSHKLNSRSYGHVGCYNSFSHLSRLCNSSVLSTSLTARALSGSSSGAYKPPDSTIQSLEETISDKNSYFLDSPELIPNPPDLIDTHAAGFITGDPSVEVVLNHLGEPTLASLGLGGWWPSGWVQTALECLHVDAGLPWWGAIITGTVVIRLCLFPFLVYCRIRTINYTNHMPTVQRLVLRTIDCHNKNNPKEYYRIKAELDSYYKRNNVRPILTPMLPLFQAPVFISMFVGLRGMANLPVESLQTGGALWFQNLAIADPYLLLPLFSMVTLFIMIEKGVEIPKSTVQMFPQMKLIMRIIPILTFFFIINFPANMAFYWAVSNVMSLLQAMILKMPEVRRKLNIPMEIQRYVLNSAPKKDFMTNFREVINSGKLIQAMEERDRLSKSSKTTIGQTFSTQTPIYKKPPQIKAVKKNT